jgi:cell division septation protein DedD
VGTTAGYYINVGLFADEANARKAQARLLNEGLPAFRQELNNSNGRRIRVRVGPYDSRAKADAAAASIRAMALDAVVFKQGR